MASRCDPTWFVWRCSPNLELRCRELYIRNSWHYMTSDNDWRLQRWHYYFQLLQCEDNTLIFCWYLSELSRRVVNFSASAL